MSANEARPGSPGVARHDQLADLPSGAGDPHLQYLLVSGTRSMAGDLDMADYDVLNVGDIWGGDASSDSLDLHPNDSVVPLSWGTDNMINLHGRATFLGFTDLSVGSGVPPPNFQLLRFDDTCDCTGQGGIIPQGFWYTPTFEYDTAQTFGGASVFQDGSIWEEQDAISGPHGYFTLGSFLAGLQYRCQHATPGVGLPPSFLFGMGSQPRADKGNATSLVIPQMDAFVTNTVFGLKAFLALEELRNGVTVTEYVHYRANSDIANGLLLHGGSTITTEIGLDLQNIAHGATAISIRSDAVGAHMTHAGDIRIPTDGKGVFLGGGLDASLLFDGSQCYLDCGLVAPADFVVDCGTQKTLRLVATVWEDLRVDLTVGKTGATRAPTFTKYKDDGAGSVGVWAWSFADQDKATDEEELFFAVQLPHRYKPGTNVEAHLHWTPAVSGGTGEFVKWGLEYTWANVDDAFGTTTIVTSDASSASTATTSGDSSLSADKHYITIIDILNGSGKDISSMLVCRLFRNSSHADDDLAQAAFALEFDFHFEIDTIGSRQPLVK